MKSALLSLFLFGWYGESCGDESWFTNRRRLGSSTWNYDDMGSWKDSYSMCNQPDQSPIDIVTFSATKDRSVCTETFDWDVDYTKTSFKLANNGHSLVLKPVEKTINSILAELEDSEGTKYQTLSYAENTIAKFPNYFQPDDSEHDSFCLDSAHFHWGVGDDTGSEHTVNGLQFPLELHFVHYSCKRASLGSTLENFVTELDVLDASIRGDDFHQLGVVGIMFDISDEDNPAFDAMFDDAVYGDLQYPAGKDVEASTVVKNLDLRGLIPSDIDTAGYYAYEGSLTTPPCTNIVRWHVMNARATISAAQIEKFRGLMMDSATNKTLAPNFREIMPTFNEVFACVPGEDEAVEEEEDVLVEEKFDGGWIVAVLAIIAAIIFLMCFVLKTWKSTELQKELSAIATGVRNRGRVMSISEDNRKETGDDKL